MPESSQKFQYFTTRDLAAMPIEDAYIMVPPGMPECFSLRLPPEILAGTLMHPEELAPYFTLLTDLDGDMLLSYIDPDKSLPSDLSQQQKDFLNRHEQKLGILKERLKIEEVLGEHYPDAGKLAVAAMIMGHFLHSRHATPADAAQLLQKVDPALSDNKIKQLLENAQTVARTENLIGAGSRYAMTRRGGLLFQQSHDTGRSH